MENFKKVVIGILLIFLLIPVTSVIRTQAKTEKIFSIQSSNVVFHIIDYLNLTNIRQHIEFFSNLGSRYTGYPGNEEAAQYIEEYFRSMSDNGIIENVTIDLFTVVVPIDYGANVTFLTGENKGRTVEIHPLLPNLVCTSTTPPSGIKGRLIYAKKGYLEDFDGWNVNGSIVLMDWNSLDRWINAAKLGAKAVIFLPPGSGEMVNSLTGSIDWPYPENPKYLPIPFNFPRFYVKEEEVSLLLKNLNQTIRVVSTQRWENVTSRNILGFIRGSENPENYIVISSYYDSFSIVPGVSPGAQEACGISSLLEIARIFSKPENRPKNSIIFLALGSHHQHYAGIIQFLKDYLYPRFGNPERISLGLHKIVDNYGHTKVKMILNLDISTGSDVVYVNTHEDNAFHGGEVDWIPVLEWLSDLVEKINMEKPKGKTYEVAMPPISQPDLANPYLISKRYGYDADACMTMSHVLGITFTTAYDDRPYFGEPFDTLDKINYENLQHQLELFLLVTTEIVNLDDVNVLVQYARNQFAEVWISEGIHVNFDLFRGRVVVWNKTKSFYSPIPDKGKVLVDIKRIFTYGNREHILFADEYGSFCLFPMEKMGGYIWITAWMIDEVTGNIIYAPDQGKHQWRKELYRHSGTYPPYPVWDWGFVVTFKASTIVLFDLSESPSIMVSGDYSSPESHGVWSADNIFVVAIPPETPVLLSGKASGARYPTELLLNSTEGNPYGSGYKLNSGQQLIIPFTHLKVAESFYWLNHEYFESIKKYDPTILSSENYREHRKTRQLIDEAHKAIASYQYSKAYSYAYEAYKLSQKVYSQTRSFMEDTAYAVPYLAFFFLPFAYLAEKLFFGWTGRRRIISFLVIFILLMVVFYLNHPGFMVVENPFVTILGFSLLILSFPVLVIVSRYMSNYLRNLRLARLGRHEIEVSRLEGTVQAFTIGIEHMKKMRLRTTLTLLTVILIVSAIVNFTSMKPLVYHKALSWHGSPLYNGIYIHKPQWGERNFEMDSIVPILKGMFGREAIAPSAWKYVLEATADNPNLKLGFHIRYGDKEVAVPILLGVTPKEEFLNLLIAGRSFMPSEKREIILTEYNAQKLGITPTDLPVRVNFEGANFTVIGILSDEINMVYDLDGEEVLPIKLDLPGDEQDWTTHVLTDYVVILPYNMVVDVFGGHTASISIKLENKSQIRDVASRITSLLPGYNVWSCVDENILLHSESLSIIIGGIETQVIPVVIASLVILNNLLGAVYERRKNIFIFNCVGLSPLHVALFFLIENVVYAVIGGILGYLYAILSTKMATIFLSGILTLNYSSRWVFISMIAAICIIISASLYPVLVAFKLSTPSLERVWRIPTKPSGDMWEISLPFHPANDAEANGILAYIWEYLRAHGIRDAPDFYARNLRLEEGRIEDKKYVGITADVSLYPYDSGVTQTSRFMLAQIDPNSERWLCRVVLNRSSGERDRWIRLNHHFIDLLRKQLLLWRSISEGEKKKYIKALNLKHLNALTGEK